MTQDSETASAAPGDPDASAIPVEDRFAAFRNPRFLRYWLSRFFSTFAIQIVVVSVGWQIYDLDDAFPTGVEVLLEGWRGPEDPLPMLPWPTITVANTLEGPWTELQVEPRMVGPYLAWQIVGDPGFRFMKLDINTNRNPLAPGKLFIRNL